MDNWTDFEKYLIKRIDSLEEKLSGLKWKVGLLSGGIAIAISLITKKLL